MYRGNFLISLPHSSHKVSLMATMRELGHFFMVQLNLFLWLIRLNRKRITIWPIRIVRQNIFLVTLFTSFPSNMNGLKNFHSTRNNFCSLSFFFALSSPFMVIQENCFNPHEPFHYRILCVMCVDVVKLEFSSSHPQCI